MTGGRLAVRAATATAVAVAAGLLAGCGQAPDGGSGSPSTASSGAARSGAPSESPSAGEAATVEVAADATELEHVHNLALSGDTLLIGSHQGLFRQPPGLAPQRVGAPFDVMGLAVVGERWLASGHPGAGMSAPADLGLLTSGDEGQTWTDVSLSGEADFHRLAVAGDLVLGVNSGDGQLWRSTDGGSTWRTVGPGPFDIAINPSDPNRVIGTTADGPISSSDGGKTWSTIDGADVVALVVWTQEQLWGVTPDGSVRASTDAGKSWRDTGRVKGDPVALAADSARVEVLAGDTVWESLDGGATFEPRVTGLPGH